MPRWLEPDFLLSSLECFSFSATCKSLNPLNRCILGYKLLAMGYWDGVSFIPHIVIPASPIGTDPIAINTPP